MSSKFPIGVETMKSSPIEADDWEAADCFLESELIADDVHFIVEILVFFENRF
jgi:hypothetical protein